MASRSTVHRTLSNRNSPFYAAAWAAFITLLIAGPWLANGYLFGTDWPGSRRFAFPTDVSSATPLEVVLALGSMVSGESTGKALVFGLLFVAALTSFLAIPVDEFMPRAAGSTVYLVNPFVYGRLHYGQLFLLGAFAILPLAVTQLRLLLSQPNATQALLAAAGFVVVGIFSPHVLLIAGVLAAALLASQFLLVQRKIVYLRRTGPWLILSLVGVAAVSSYWLVPLLLGRGPEGTLVAGAGEGDVAAFASVPDHVLGLVPNLLGLYGFWAENSGRFTSMKAFLPFWPAVLAAMLLVAATGAGRSVRNHPESISAWVWGLLIAASIGLVLEMGVSAPVTAGLVRWLDAHIVLYRGMRDAGKWAAVLALAYSQLFGLGVAGLLHWVRDHVRNPVNAEWATSAVAAVFLALPLSYGNGLLFGAHGEIKPSHYPSGWYAADRMLSADTHPGRTLFLPWHEYMRYSFVENENQVVAPPAPNFFSVPVLVSADPEVPGIAPPTSPDQVAIRALVTAGSKGRWAQVLTHIGVKYVLVAKELDWQSYAFLDLQSGLTKVADLGSVLVYLNTAMI